MGIEPPPAEVIDSAVHAALAEDRAFEDVTTLATVTPSLRGTARFLAKEPGTLAGMPVALVERANEILRHLETQHVDEEAGNPAAGQDQKEKIKLFATFA